MNPLIIQNANQELQKRVGEDFVYEPLLGDRLPPLNYRN
jgi:aminobenzoyl-glutamate utilization protein B